MRKRSLVLFCEKESRGLTLRNILLVCHEQCVFSKARKEMEKVRMQEKKERERKREMEHERFNLER